MLVFLIFQPCAALVWRIQAGAAAGGLGQGRELAAAPWGLEHPAVSQPG